MALVVVVAIIGVAGAAFIIITGGSGEASTDILDAADGTALDAEAGTTVFAIVPQQSQVRFTLQEDLRGVRTTVVGATDQVAGEIGVNFTAPAESEIGTITINVRTLATDSGLRDSAIRGQILLSSQAEYEFATFTPTSTEGLPASVTLGEAFTFTVTGDLTLKGITAPVTFTVEVTPVSNTLITGNASAMVDRTDWDLQIPSVPSVANVDEQVMVEIEFTAQAVEPAADA